MDKEKIKEMLEGIFGNFSTEITKKMEENSAFAANVETRLGEIEKQMASVSKSVSLPGVDEVKETFSFTKAFGALISGDWSKAGFEKEVIEETRKKAMTAGSDTAGGFIIPNEYVPELIELYMANSVVIQSGATVLSGLTSSPIEIPKQTSGSTTYWLGENTEIPESALTVGQINMTPKRVAALVKLSNRLIKLANPSVEAMVRRDIGQSIALAIDLACLRGTGVDGEPIGIAYTSGINTVVLGAAGAVPDFDTLYDMEYELEADNALKGRLGYIFAPAIKRVLRKLKVAQYSGDTKGMYIIQPTSEAELSAWIGYPFKTTTQIPTNLTKSSATNCTEIYFGNWQELMIGQWGGVEISVSKETSDAFTKNQTWVKIEQEVDTAVRHPESFCLCNDAKIA
jgi:HK97 family phage major capsid protein